MEDIQTLSVISFFFLLYHFIRNKYENTEIVFISHSSEAKEVSEDDFFKRVSSGGTIISSALEKCVDIISYENIILL